MGLRSALWADRWPLIALQECVDQVNAAEPERRQEVKWNLPCSDCPQASRCLNAKRKELGPLLYDREILTSPRSAESSLFPFELMEPMLNREASCVPHYRKPYSLEAEYGVASGWDIAWSERIGGDWMVKFTGLVHRPTGRKTLLDIARWQRLTFDQQMALIASEWAKYQDDVVAIEADAAQTVWSQHLASNTAVPVLRHYASGKGDLAQGIPSLLIGLENRKWEVPFQRGSYHHEEVRVWLSELEAFGWQDDKLQGVGEHDDTVMAWYHCSWALDQLVAENATRRTREGIQPGRYI